MASPSKLRVLHVAPAYYPAVIYGGPTFSTMALCDGLAASGAVAVSVLTTDSNGPRVSDRVEIDSNPAWFAAGYFVQYCRRLAFGSFSVEFLRRLPGAIRNADLVHLTSTYSFTTIPTLLLARTMGRPVVWSPRGSLQATQQWDGAPKRRLKRLFERLCQLARPCDTILLVTAPIEAELSVVNLPGIATAEIPNPIDLPPLPEARAWRPEGRLRLMFLSRLHPKKGIELLLSALARLPETVTLDVYGTGTPNYEAKLQAAADRLGIAARLKLHGHVEGEVKTQAFADADILCLPTHSENFGIVVGEALAHGLPVITTTAAPWSGLETHDCGRWIERDEDTLIAAIQDLGKADLKAMGQRGRAWMERDFSPTGVTQALLSVYRRLLDDTSGRAAASNAPDCLSGNKDIPE